MRWTTTLVAGKMLNVDTIIADFKMKMAMILKGNKGNKRNRGFAVQAGPMVKNFEPKTRKKFKSISKVIFKYGRKQLAKAERNRDAIEGKKIDIVVKWASTSRRLRYSEQSNIGHLRRCGVSTRKNRGRMNILQTD
jgi:hypothetical protein